MLLKQSKIKWFILFALMLILLLVNCASVVYGYTDTSWAMVYQALTQFNGSNEHLIVQNMRIPRALIATTVGAALSVAGCLMQALTKNPLASPGIFGINAGAGFFVVGGMLFFNVHSSTGMTTLAFIGATVTAVIVYVAGSIGNEGLTPIKLTLAGAAMAAMFSSLTQGMLAVNESALEQVLFWLAGSVKGGSLDLLFEMMPCIIIALLVSFLLGEKINTLLMGEDVARGLGQNTLLLKLSMSVCIVLLAGSAVAIAGPISFIGMMVPHFARFISGHDHRWMIPYSALMGAILLVTADLGARYIIMPEEVPVGVMTAMIGLPIFVYIARRRLDI